MQKGFHSVSSSMRPPVAIAICSRWLEKSNVSSDACPHRPAPRATWSIQVMPKVKEDIMDDAISAGRRRFLGAAGMTIAAAGFGAVEVGGGQRRRGASAGLNGLKTVALSNGHA